MKKKGVFDRTKAGGGTGSLKQHLDSCHKGWNPQKPTGNIAQMVASGGRSFRWDAEKSELAIVNCIVVHNLPFVLAERPEFLTILQTYNPHAKGIPQTTLRRRISTQYGRMYSKLVSIFSNLDSKIALTTDCWSSPHKSYPFMAITAHWIDIDWKQRNCIVDFIHLEGSHTGENMAGALVKSCSDLGIGEQQIVGIVTDNAANNGTMLECIQATWNPSNEDDKFTKKQQQIRCFAHVLNLCAQKMLETLKSAAVDASVMDVEEMNGGQLDNRARAGKSLHIRIVFIFSILFN